MRFVPVAVWTALAASGVPLPASAQVVPIAVGQSKDFKHKHSGIVIAASAAGIPRFKVGQYDQDQLNVMADFRTPDEREITTIYVYRNVSGSVAVWFDRAQTAVSISPMLGSTSLVYPAASFTPAGRGAGSGLRAAYSASGQAWKSSAVALTQVGDWYVKVRASSQTMSPQELLARVDSTLAAIRWPKEKKPPTAVTPVADCAERLSLKPAKLALASQEDSIMAALLGGVANQISQNGEIKGTLEPYCREPGISQPEYGVYRAGGSKEHYMIALGDSGMAIHVGADQLGALVAQGNGPMRYGVSFVALDQSLTFAQFESMPTFDQALQLVETGRPISSSGTWGKKSRNITISTQ